MQNKTATQATTATTEVNNIVKQDTLSIEREIKSIENSIGHFQPLLDALFSVNYKPTVKQLCEIVYDKRALKGTGAALDAYLSRETLSRTPSVNNMPVKEEFKLAMIEIPSECSRARSEYSKLTTDEKTLRNIYSLDVNPETGKLFVPDSIRQKITDKHTQYGCDVTMKAIELAENIVTQIKQLDAMTGAFALSNYSGCIFFNGVTNEYAVNRGAIGFQVAKHRKETKHEPSLDEVING